MVGAALVAAVEVDLKRLADMGINGRIGSFSIGDGKESLAYVILFLSVLSSVIYYSLGIAY